jgi:hypothetical protein
LILACEENAKKLQEIFQKVVEDDDTSWVERYKKATQAVMPGKKRKVEDLMKEILEKLHLLHIRRFSRARISRRTRRSRRSLRLQSASYRIFLPLHQKTRAGTVTMGPARYSSTLVLRRSRSTTKVVAPITRGTRDKLRTSDHISQGLIPSRLGSAGTMDNIAARSSRATGGKKDESVEAVEEAAAS